VRNDTAKSPALAMFLNLLLPGLGHLLWREWLFGLFIFLIMLIAVILFVVSLLVPLGLVVKILLLGLPLIFYGFSFVDLHRTVRTRQKTTAITGRTALVLVGLGLVYQIGAPSAPLNFALTNLPELYRQEDSRLAPKFHRGDLLKASQLSYFIHLVFLDQPIMHALPERYDIVRFKSEGEVRRSGIVLGRSGESVALAEGVMVVNGLPDLGASGAGFALGGACPLTVVKEYSILVATLNGGVVDQVYQVPFSDIVGKVSRLF
jgi:hypothetical protein